MRNRNLPRWYRRLTVRSRRKRRQARGAPPSPWRASFQASLAVHCLLVIGLGLVAFEVAPRSRVELRGLLPAASPARPLLLDLPTMRLASDPDPLAGRLPGQPRETRLPDAPEIDSPLPNPVAGPADAVVRREDVGPAKWELALPLPATSGGGFQGRTPAARAQLVGQRGGTPASEDAVARGLAWLAAHQREDGGWRFDHRQGACSGMCRNPGSEGSTTGATGLALLPFLGAGETQEDSLYRSVVDRGLYYLASRLLLTPRGGDLQEGTMYAQAIAAIALGEGYALLGDESLRPVAQHAVDFICNAQHEGGGWRYFPGQPGDTTVFGWQLMALKSARLAGLSVPETVFTRAEAFLDSVQADEGAAYGYMTPEQLPAPTAIGLLSRMYLGWSQDDPRLARGVAYLAGLGPSETDMYFDYYATQALHHHEGPEWEPWNTRMRDHLVATQVRSGHEHGSWYFEDEHGQAGGRLYTTAMCVMILEVYYRYMPLYTRAAIDSTDGP